MPVQYDPTLVGALARAASGTAGVSFVGRDEGITRYSWAEIRERAGRFAGGLRRAGVAPGDRVAVILPTGPEFFDAFFGALVAGAIPVPLYPPVRLGRLDEYHRATARMLANGIAWHNVSMDYLAECAKKPALKAAA